MPVGIPMLAGYRGSPTETRDPLLRRRDGLRKRSRRVWRRGLPRDLRVELEEWEAIVDDENAAHELDGALEAYDKALEAALAATQQMRVKAPRVIAFALMVFGVFFGRIAYNLRDYPAIVESCATHHHCEHAGECFAEIVHNGYLGVKTICVAAP